MRVFKLAMDGSSCTDKDVESLLEELRLLSTEGNTGDSATLTVVEMTETDYEALPEFTGW